MKATKISMMVLGVVFLMFVIIPNVSAQDFFKGKVSLKGYEIENGGATLLDKVSGAATAYFKIEAGAGQYTVTTCLEDFDNPGQWTSGTPSIISASNIYSGTDVAIWDFASTESGLNFPPDIDTFPMFYVKTKGTLATANFKSFACLLWEIFGVGNLELGSCSITFKYVDRANVPINCFR